MKLIWRTSRVRLSSHADILAMPVLTVCDAFGTRPFASLQRKGGVGVCVADLITTGGSRASAGGLACDHRRPEKSTAMITGRTRRMDLRVINTRRLGPPELRNHVAVNAYSHLRRPSMKRPNRRSHPWFGERLALLRRSSANPDRSVQFDGSSNSNTCAGCSRAFFPRQVRAAGQRQSPHSPRR